MKPLPDSFRKLGDCTMFIIFGVSNSSGGDLTISVSFHFDIIIQVTNHCKNVRKVGRLPGDHPDGMNVLRTQYR